MNGQLQALKAEWIKNKHSPILWVSFIAFSLAPVMGGVFMLMMKDPQVMANPGSLNTKIKMMEFSANWDAYLGILTQAVGVGGILIFGFVASWIFGREYSDGTAKDLLALPVSRTRIINAKFIIYFAWCLALVVSNLLIGFLLGTLLQIPGPAHAAFTAHINTYFITTLLTLALGTPIAFFAIWGKGYLAPLGFVALTLVFAQVIAAAGYGNYFPWSVPGIFSGSAGKYKDQLNLLSYAVLFLAGIAGYILTIQYWKYADQTE